MNLLNLFDLSLVGRRDEIGLEWNRGQFTFGEIEARSNRVANALRDRGFQKGDRLCVYLANRIELIDIFIACVKLGVIFVPINILYRGREIEHIVGDAEPRAVITENDLLSSADESRPSEIIDGETAAAIIYTSGTTGRSKGAILTHNNFMNNSVNLLASWQITHDDRSRANDAKFSHRDTGTDKYVGAKPDVFADDDAGDFVEQRGAAAHGAGGEGRIQDAATLDRSFTTASVFEAIHFGVVNDAVFLDALVMSASDDLSIQNEN